MQENSKSGASAWSSQKGVAAVEIAPLGRPIAGEIVLPGSKSETNRALIFAASAQGTSEIRGILKSDDSYWCLTALRQLGAVMDEQDGAIRVAGTGARWKHAAEPIFIGSAGTIARFLPGLLCPGDGDSVLEGSAQLSNRPIQPLTDALVALGADIQYVERAGHLPIRIGSQRLRGGSVRLSGAISSQFLSGVLMASPLAREPVEIHLTDAIVQPGYISLTIALMKKFGVAVQVDRDFRRFTVAPQAYQAAAVDIDADASTASYFMALAALTHGEITIRNLRLACGQPDIQFVEVLKRLGCTVESGPEGISVRSRGRLQGGQTFDMKAISDVALTLAAMAPFADGPIQITGVEHIRFHECDRLSAMAKSLSLLGIKVEEARDGLTIWPGNPGRVALDTYEDHRVAMSLAVVGAAANGVILRDPGCVSKTFPGFFAELASLGVETTFPQSAATNPS